MLYQFRGYLPLIQSSSIISLEQLTFWKVSLITCFIWFIWWYYYRYRAVFKEKHQQIILQRLDEFEPEPLIKADPVSMIDLTSVEGIQTSTVQIKDIDLASNDFLSLRNERQIKMDAQDAILKYGVGTCGPRTFYGTFGVHEELEKALNNWLSIENEDSRVLLYSNQQCTISSVVAAFCKANSLCFIDEQCGQSMNDGLKLKRVENVVQFKHNSSENLQQHLDKYFAENESKCNNWECRFLLIEGIYSKTGKILNVELLKLARKYNIRVILDESLSLGTIGKSGKGIVEYYNLKCRLELIDITIGSLEHALHSTGGFTLSSRRCWMEQQILSTGYLFSASLPVFSAKAALTALDFIKTRKIDNLRQLSNKFQLVLEGLNHFKVCSSKDSPLKVLVCKNMEALYKHYRVNGVFMNFKKNSLVYNGIAEDALYLQLKLEFLDNNMEKLDRIYKVLSSTF